MEYQVCLKYAKDGVLFCDRIVDTEIMEGDDSKGSIRLHYRGFKRTLVVSSHREIRPLRAS